MYGLSYVDLPEAVPEDEHTHQNENGGGQSQALVMLSDPVSNPEAAEAPKFYETTNQGSSIADANNGSSIVVMSKGPSILNNPTNSKPLSAVHDEERMHDGLVAPPMPTAPTPPVLKVTVF
ncbi:hypothetical protein Tco_1356755 [Tanacetum coccineum]